MDKKITAKRLRELEMAERTLLALQAGGVDNWDGYDSSLEGLRKEAEQKEQIETILDEVEAALMAGAYEPSERGAGHCSTDEGRDEALSILIAGINEIIKIG